MENEKGKKTIEEILKEKTQKKASDVFIVPGLPLSYKINNQLINDSEERLMPTDTAELIRQIYKLTDNRDMSKLLTLVSCYFLYHENKSPDGFVHRHDLSGLL